MCMHVWALGLSCEAPAARFLCDVTPLAFSAEDPSGCACTGPLAQKPGTLKHAMVQPDKPPISAQQASNHLDNHLTW